MEMAYRSQKTSGVAIVLAGLWLAPALFAQRELRYEALHDHWRGSGAAKLTITGQGISFEEPGKKGKVRHQGGWTYQDIQELKLSDKELTIVTYKDRKWRLGADQQYKFTIAGGHPLREVYSLLKDRLDQRLVAAIADPDVPVLWEIPVKLLGTVTGSEGILRAGADHVVYATESASQSRTWRYQDIENVSTSGPFQLTVITFERAKLHYGSLKGFNFQLKQPLDEKRFDLLWRRLNRSKGLEFLTSIQERSTDR